MSDARAIEPPSLLLPFLKKWRLSRMELSALEQQVLLAVIGLHPNAYGISIADHVERRAGYEPPVGSIYAAIDRLVEKGYVRTRQGEPTAARRGKRKLYVTITAPGQIALEQSLRAISSLSRGLRLKESVA
jgi:DNA-binding PadR family transcriptional regulator